MITDHQAHLLPRSYFEGIAGRRVHPRCTREGSGYLFEPRPHERWSITAAHLEIDLQLESMAEVGIDKMVSSPNVMCDVGSMDPGEARETVALANEETARLQRQHADRFLGLAMLPMQDTEAALETLEHAVTGLGLVGVCMLSNIAERPLVSEATAPVFERIDQLGVPLFLHPANRSAGFGENVDPVVEVGLSWMWDTSVAALSLITSGMLDRCSSLTVVHPHLGGVLPYVVGRVGNVDRMASSSYDPGGPERPGGDRNVRPVREYLRDRFYVDTVGATTGALALALATYGVDRVLFATDFPWLPDRSARLGYVKGELSEQDAAKVLSNGLDELRPVS